MAATVTGAKVVLGGAASENLTECQLSGLTAGVTEVVPHNGPTGVAPHNVQVFVTTPATDGTGVVWSWTNRTSSTTNCNLKFDCAVGGSLDGMVVVVQFRFIPSAASGQSTITTT